MQKLLTIFQLKSITAIDYVSTVRLNESSANDYVKLTLL